MDTASIQGFIGSLGFPIFMCLAMMFYFKKTLDSLTKTVEANTRVMLVIATKIGVGIPDDSR